MPRVPEMTPVQAREVAASGSMPGLRSRARFLASVNEPVVTRSPLWKMTSLTILPNRLLLATEGVLLFQVLPGVALPEAEVVPLRSQYWSAAWDGCRNETDAPAQAMIAAHALPCPLPERPRRTCPPVPFAAPKNGCTEMWNHFKTEL